MILVTGGTGTVGRRIVQGLVDNQLPVRVYARGQSEWKDNPMPRLRKLGVDVISADIRQYDKLSIALDGCTAVIHCANIMWESPGESLEAVNVEPMEKLLELAAEAGVQRFIYIGCLGSSQYSTSKYLRSKWQAESIVRASKFYWTIFRPSLVFAESSLFVQSVEFWAAKGPFVMVVGSGLNELQAVSADVVAACVVQSLFNRDTVHQSYDLVGPVSYSLTEVLESAGQAVTSKSRPVVKVPSPIGYGLASIMHKLNPRSPMSEDVMRVLTSDYTGDPAIMQSTFDVENTPLESYFRGLRRLGRIHDDNDDEDEDSDENEDEDYED